jgi:hypothetical protein
MKETFDIFLGIPEKPVMWMSCVEGRSNARDRMEQMAAAAPGRYFLFCTGTHTSICEIETFPIPRPRPVLVRAISSTAQNCSPND